jgi:hypothetical protein
MDDLSELPFGVVSVSSICRDEYVITVLSCGLKKSASFEHTNVRTVMIIQDYQVSGLHHLML